MTVKDEAVDNHIEHIINFRRRLHRKPELSFEEYQTTNLIDNGLGDTRIKFRMRLHREPERSFEEFQKKNIIENGLGDTKIKFHEHSEKTGLIGVMEKDPGLDYIGVRADMDALPVTEMTELDFKSEKDGVMHACGHDIHTSIVYGFANVINEMYDDLKYNLVFIFQPAEEVLGGAKYIKSELERLEIPVDKIVMFHTWPTLKEGLIGYREEDMMAGSTSFD